MMNWNFFCLLPPFRSFAILMWYFCFFYSFSKYSYHAVCAWFNSINHIHSFIQADIRLYILYYILYLLFICTQNKSMCGYDGYAHFIFYNDNLLWMIFGHAMSYTRRPPQNWCYSCYYYYLFNSFAFIRNFTHWFNWTHSICTCIPNQSFHCYY